MKIRDIQNRFFSRFIIPSKSEEIKIDEFREQIKEVEFHFREGFSERVVTKLKTLREIDPLDVYYNNLSGLFPKILGFSFAAIILMGIIIFALNGTLSPDKLFGADRVDENNFITYLIIQR